MPKIPIERWIDTPDMRPEDIKEIIVHCSDSETGDVLDIDRWHRDRGWTGIGYHIVIDREGRVDNGRPLNKFGAHTLGHNHCSIGICLIGKPDKISDNPEDWFGRRQLLILKSEIEQLLHDYPSIELVAGHNEFANKICPGFWVRSAEHPLGRWISSQVTRIKALRDAGVE